MVSLWVARGVEVALVVVTGHLVVAGSYVVRHVPQESTVLLELHTGGHARDTQGRASVLVVVADADIDAPQNLSENNDTSPFGALPGPHRSGIRGVLGQEKTPGE